MLICVSHTFLFFQITYEQKIQKYIRTIQSDMEAFGWLLYGDGVTVRKMPLMNLLASVPEETSACLEIVDCTGHLNSGGKKDAEYLSRTLCQPLIEKVDPGGKHIDLIVFDGASNVQKAGEVIEALYPRCSVIQGAEHVVSLFFKDVSKLAEIKTLIVLYRKCYAVFGSGSMHSAYALFCKQARAFNSGKKIGLIRAADTRMAGYFIGTSIVSFFFFPSSLSHHVSSSFIFFSNVPNAAPARSIDGHCDEF